MLEFARQCNNEPFSFPWFKDHFGQNIAKMFEKRTKTDDLLHRTDCNKEIISEKYYTLITLNKKSFLISKRIRPLGNDLSPPSPLPCSEF